MEPTRDMKITNLEVTISLLQREERRLQEQIAYPNAAPEHRADAQAALAQVLEKIRAAVDEVTRLELES
jgi:hypothetical protein